MSATDASAIVELDRDHPGFRDPVYRSRRNFIAGIALRHPIASPAPRIEYTEAEHGVWRTAFHELEQMHVRYACAEHLECFALHAFSRDRIPQLADVSSTLLRATGFSMSPVAGLVTPAVFMSALGAKRFLATQYVRHHSAPLYTPEPDVLHEIIGHAALLAHPEFAAVNRLFGDATDRADEATISALIRVYWYALEFGVVEAPSGLRVVGAGLLSSYGELGRFERGPELRPMSIEAMAATPFDPTDYQRVLFVAKSTRALLSELRTWLESIAAA